MKKKLLVSSLLAIFAGCNLGTSDSDGSNDPVNQITCDFPITGDEAVIVLNNLDAGILCGDLISEIDSDLIKFSIPELEDGDGLRVNFKIECDPDLQVHTRLWFTEIVGADVFAQTVQQGFSDEGDLLFSNVYVPEDIVLLLSFRNEIEGVNIYNLEYWVSGIYND